MVKIKFWMETTIGVIIILILVLLLTVAVDYIFYETITVSGQVMYKYTDHETSWMPIRVAGRTQLIRQSNTYYKLVMLIDGEECTIDVKKDDYKNARIGYNITVQTSVRRGRID